LPMLAKVQSGAVIGVDAYVVDVEVDITQGLPTFATVGLPEAAVRESKERVKAAIKNSGYAFPADRITVNLAPADTKKEGTGFDLPIALGILAATGLVDRGSCKGHLFIGELALDGLIRPVRGVLPMAITAKALGYEGIFLPIENAHEAAVVEGVRIYPIESLFNLVEVFR
jgi:magnesium chelatase family protein